MSDYFKTISKQCPIGQQKHTCVCTIPSVRFLLFVSSRVFQPPKSPNVAGMTSHPDVTFLDLPLGGVSRGRMGTVTILSQALPGEIQVTATKDPLAHSNNDVEAYQWRKLPTSKVPES